MQMLPILKLVYMLSFFLKKDVFINPPESFNVTFIYNIVVFFSYP